MLTYLLLHEHTKNISVLEVLNLPSLPGIPLSWIPTLILASSPSMLKYHLLRKHFLITAFKTSALPCPSHTHIPYALFFSVSSDTLDAIFICSFLYLPQPQNITCIGGKVCFFFLFSLHLKSYLVYNRFSIRHIYK